MSLAVIEISLCSLCNFSLDKLHLISMASPDVFVTKSLWGCGHTKHCGMTHDTMYLDVIYIVFTRTALIIEKYFRFSQHMCLITYFHHRLNVYGFKS